MPALQQQLQAALLAAQQQKRETLPVHNQCAHLLGQTKSLADKMDQQAKLAQETTRKRDQLREELVTVYVRLEKLPTEPLPVPKTPVANSSDVPGGPTLWIQRPSLRCWPSSRPNLKEETTKPR
eukprot:2897782-Amphidinium_carterae.1